MCYRTCVSPGKRFRGEVDRLLATVILFDSGSINQFDRQDTDVVTGGSHWSFKSFVLPPFSDTDLIIRTMLEKSFSDKPIFTTDHTHATVLGELISIFDHVQTRVYGHS